MPRSDPRRSDYCATRHLLRHLDDPSALRRNPLAPNGNAPNVVARAIAHMDAAGEARWRAARHTVILLRVDVAGEAQAAVARDLGVSERQLRRERRVAHARFLEALRELAAPEPAAVHERTADLQIASAERLADSGEPRSALAILDDIAARASDPAARCRALVRAADVETDLHRLGAAAQRLHDAAGLLHEHVVPDDSQHGLEREHRVSALQVAWFEAGPSSIVPEAERTQEADDARMWMLRACAALRSGNGRGARALAQLARSALRPTNGNGIRVDLEILDAELADFLDGNSPEAQRRYLRAIALADQLGYRGRSLWSTHLLAFTRWLHDPKAEHRAAYRALVDRIDASMPEQHRLMLYFSAADIELAIGSPRRAAVAAQGALALATNAYEQLSAQALGAGALLRLGFVAQAESAACTTAEAAREHGFLRIVSTTQRLAAQAAMRRGQPRLARGRIDDAIACAAGRTSAYVLALTHDVAARITRDRRHAVLARELRSAGGASA